MLLYDEEQVKEAIREYLNSHEWWTFFQQEGDGIAQIEEKFYSGEANADFHLVFGPNIPGFSVAFAKKSRMSAHELATFLEHSVEAIIERDVITLCGVEPTRENAMRYLAAVKSFSAWLGPVEGPIVGLN